jgi:hypothetical protein
METGAPKAADLTACAKTAEAPNLRSDSGQPVDASTALAAELLALGQDCAARIADPWRTADHGALLYDDKGLPR